MRTYSHPNTPTGRRTSLPDTDHHSGGYGRKRHTVPNLSVTEKCQLKQHTQCPKASRVWCECPCHKSEAEYA